MRLAPIALIMALAGCIVVPARPPPPPPPRPSPTAPLSEQQAVDLAAEHARARGLDIRRTTRAFLDGKGRWHVDLAGPDSHASVIVDSTSGRVVRSRLRLGPPPPPQASPPPPAPPPPPGLSPGPPPGPPAAGERRQESPQRRDDDWDE